MKPEEEREFERGVCEKRERAVGEVRDILLWERKHHFVRRFPGSPVSSYSKGGMNMKTLELMVPHSGSREWQPDSHFLI